MQNNVSYSGISSKIKAMSSGLVSPSMYEEISALSSVPEFTVFLYEHTPYRKYLGQTDTRLLHRGEIESFLSRGVYEDFKKLYRFADKSQRNYLRLYFKTFEIELLKKNIRRVMNESISAAGIICVDDFFKSHTRLNADVLMSASSIQELSEALQKTEYHDIINAISAYPGNSAFDYELALNVYYYRTIWRVLTRKCSGLDAEILKNSYGIRIDLLNLSSIYRGRFHFKLDYTRILDLTIPCNYKLKDSEVFRLIHCSSIDEFNRILADTYYGRHFNIDNADILIREYENISYNIDIKATKTYPYSIAAVFAYLAHKEREQKSLTRALEAIRYGLNQRQILEYINGGSPK